MLEPHQNGDRSIMDVITLHFTKTWELKAINRVRQFYGGVHMSNLASPVGRTLNTEFLSRV